MRKPQPSSRDEVVRENLARYRVACRREQISDRYSGRVHLAVISLVYGSAVAGAMYFAGAQRSAAWWLFPLAWAVANLAEYQLHRWPMHNKRRRFERLYKRHAATHHRFFTHRAMSVDGPQDYALIFFPAWMHGIFIFALGLPIVLGAGALLGLPRAAVFGAGIASYILSYEWLHLAAHLPRIHGIEGLPLLGAIARHHRRHHDPSRMRHVNFSIFLPLADLVFGTLSRDDEAPAPVAQERTKR